MSAEKPSGENITVSEIFRSLTIKQTWGLGFCVAAVIGGSVALGSWVQSARDDDKIAEKNGKIAELNSRIDDLGKQQKDDQAKIDGASSAVKAMSRRYNALKGKSDFLEHYLTYVNSPIEASRKVFINYVCALWRQSEEYSIHVDRAPLDIRAAEIMIGSVTPELREFLLSQGIPDEFLDRATTPAPSPSTVVSRRPPYTQEDAAATVQKMASGITLEKIVHFFDGTSYRVPNEIAVAVHLDSNCAPR
jgi:outer membrane murein-binding lipoprotein Lpp